MSQLNSRQPWLHRAAVALLRSDQPAPLRSDGEIAAEVARNYRWNFTVSLMDNTAFWFGISFISASTIVPLFISKLTSSPLPIGLAAVIAQGAWFLPQLFTANVVERLPRKKPVAVNLGLVLERLPVWLLIVAALAAARSPRLALVLFFVGYAWRGLGGGAVATAWQDLIARCFPVDHRGRLFGLGNFLGAGVGTAGAVLSTWLLQNLTFPENFACLFLLAALSLLASWFFLSLMREPVQPTIAPRASHREFLGRLPNIMRRDHNFRRFLVARSLLAMGGMGLGFVTVSAIQRWHVPDGTVGYYTAASWMGQTVGTLAFGLLADRFGHKLSLELGAMASVLGYALAWLTPSPAWIFTVFVLLGINLGAVLTSGILVALEFSEPERRPTYAGLTNTFVGLSNIAAPLVGAWLASAGYGWLFAVGAAVNLVALAAMHWWVREPRWMPTVPLSSFVGEPGAGERLSPEGKP
jgi:MFS family permease